MNKIINSQERCEGIAIQVFGAILLLPTSVLAYLSLATNSSGALLGAGAFFFFALLLLIIGAFQKRKFNLLGTTPLTLTPAYCTIGEEFTGSIKIDRPAFNCVNQVSITLWKQSKTTGDNYKTDKVWQATTATKITAVDQATFIAFKFTIPRGMTPTTKSVFSSSKFFWQISFEFVEAMENIKRTWQIPVKN